MVELESEGELTRREVATFLREFANELDDGAFGGGERTGEHRGELVDEEGQRSEFVDEDERRDELADEEERRSELVDEEDREEHADEEVVDPKRITFIVGGDSATVTVPDTLEFDVEVESRSPMFGSGVSQEIGLELSWEIEATDEELGGDRIEIG